MNVRGDGWASGRFVAVVPPHRMHRDGWNHYLDRLAVPAAGGDPGPDAAAPPSDPDLP
jgi:hypothetical protein